MVNKDSKTSEEILLPRKGEGAVITSKVKTAGLCYDRVWCPPENVFGWGEEFPEAVRFFGGTVVERTISFDIKNKSIKTFPSMKKLFKSEEGLQLIKKSTLGLMAELMLSRSKEELAERLEKTTKIPVTSRQGFLENTNIITDLIYRDIARVLSGKYKIPVATICDSKANRRVAYSGGDKDAVVVCLEDLEIVDEEQLTWELVLEFRADEENQRRYKRFLHWLDKEMLGKSQAFIEDEISMKLEDYERALRKHGIKTVIGTIEEVLDGKYLLGASGVAGSLTLAGHPTLGALAAGLLIGGKIGVKLIQTKLDFDDVERGPNSEISWVYEVKKLDS